MKTTQYLSMRKAIIKSPTGIEYPEGVVSTYLAFDTLKGAKEWGGKDCQVVKINLEK